MSYYEYKLHAVSSINVEIESVDISTASVQDIYYLKIVESQMNSCVILGDKGY